MKNRLVFGSFHFLTSSKNKKEISCVHFSIFIFSGKLKSEKSIEFLLNFLFLGEKCKIKNKHSFFSFLKKKVTLNKCFQNHVIRSFHKHFLAKLKGEMAELSTGLVNSDEFITLSRGHGEARVDRKLKKTQVNTERLVVMFGVS